MATITSLLTLVAIIAAVSAIPERKALSARNKRTDDSAELKKLLNQFNFKERDSSANNREISNKYHDELFDTPKTSRIPSSNKEKVQKRQFDANPPIPYYQTQTSTQDIVQDLTTPSFYGYNRYPRYYQLTGYEPFLYQKDPTSTQDVGQGGPPLPPPSFYGYNRYPRYYQPTGYEPFFYQKDQISTQDIHQDANQPPPPSFYGYQGYPLPYPSGYKPFLRQAGQAPTQEGKEHSFYTKNRHQPTLRQGGQTASQNIIQGDDDESGDNDGRFYGNDEKSPNLKRGSYEGGQTASQDIRQEATYNAAERDSRKRSYYRASGRQRVGSQDQSASQDIVQEEVNEEDVPKDFYQASRKPQKSKKAPNSGYIRYYNPQNSEEDRYQNFQSQNPEEGMVKRSFESAEPEKKSDDFEQAQALLVSELDNPITTNIERRTTRIKKITRSHLE